MKCQIFHAEEITNVRSTSSVLSYEKDQRIVTYSNILTLTDKQYAQLICPQKSNRKFNMEKEDNKNYGSVTIVTLITLLASAGIIYLIITVLN